MQPSKISFPFESRDNSFPQPFERYSSARLHQPRLFNPREELSLQIRSRETACVLLPLKFIRGSSGDSAIAALDLSISDNRENSHLESRVEEIEFSNVEFFSIKHVDIAEV
ncbi:hypothetical protein CDAR_108911 [Caerostris darwini]|uniref:Uncharacterized protein n=1 Tax=Caerostris darwini TaxID=1538125 RepID=A0AAV4QSA7_9ARAC|nr:hypothetical protein CDAR_108911 [Caerostris darwini]